MSHLSNHLAPWIDPRVQSVNVADLSAYLHRHGWKLTASPRPQLRCYSGPLDDDGEPLVLMIPSEERGSDYLELMIRAITTLSLIEDRYAVEVLNDILQPPPAAELPNGQKEAREPTSVASGAA